MRTQFLETFDFKSKYFWNYKVRTDAMEIVSIRFNDTECLSRIKM